MLHIISSNCPSLLQRARSAVAARDCVVIIGDVVDPFDTNGTLHAVYHQFAQSTAATFILAQSEPLAVSHPLVKVCIDHERLLALCETHHPIFTWY